MESGCSSNSLRILEVPWAAHNGPSTSQNGPPKSPKFIINNYEQNGINVIIKKSNINYIQCDIQFDICISFILSIKNWSDTFE